MFSSAVFAESLKLVSCRAYIEKDSHFKGVVACGDVQILGLKRKMKLEDIRDGGRRLRCLLVSYLCRNNDGLSEHEAKKIIVRIKLCTFWARVRFLVSEEMHTASAYLNMGTIELIKLGNRANYFVAVEIDDDETSSDIYYGRVLRLLEMDITSNDFPISQQLFSPALNRTYSVGVFDWANELRVGNQRQVFH
ncbi:unnamed protein product [Agarophyton chilense]